MADVIYLNQNNEPKVLSARDVRLILLALPGSPENPSAEVTEGVVQVNPLESLPLHADSVRVEICEENSENWVAIGQVTPGSGPTFPSGGVNKKLRFVAVNPNGESVGDYIII